MTNPFWLTDERMERVKPSSGKQAPGLFSDPPNSRRAMVSLTFPRD